jgi:endonuclease/exonuclease/phosphatase family metal-dependent hydrolase
MFYLNSATVILFTFFSLSGITAPASESCPPCKICPKCPDLIDKELENKDLQDRNLRDKEPLDQEIEASSNEGIKVLTYNICWECLSNSSSGTAGNLGKQCLWTKKNNVKVTTCAVNMANTIDETSAHYGGLQRPFDFVGLQEAKHSADALQRMSEALENLYVVDPNSGLLSFYNGAKYTLRHKISSSFSSGRPILILIFKEKFIFVNVHAPHIKSNNRQFFEEKLSEALQSRLGKDEIAALKDHRIIVVGDFNDHRNALTIDEKAGKYFVPFRNAGLMTPVFLENTDDLGACCSTRIPYEKNKRLLKGDYIFDSVSKKDSSKFYLKVPSNYDYTKPGSDHLPVIYLAK